MSGLENSSSTKDERASHGGFNHYEFASYTALQCILLMSSSWTLARMT